MTLSEIQDQINDFIVANGNNEITADVLRPILLGIVGQPNELIGDLTNLTTDEQSSIVAAINEINASLADAGGITIHTGAYTPLVTPPGSYTTGDFYLQEAAGVVVSFWQFNGTTWVEIKNVIDDANTTASTTWSSEKIQQAINERDGFITLGAIAYTDNSATIPAGAEWRIAGVTYTNPAEVILTINPATAGYYRTDIIVANTSNTFQIVEGTESTGTVAPAAAPANTVKADEINLYGAAVVSTGPGGGFVNVVGFFDYNDEATQTTPIAFSTGIPVKLTNDALGPFTNLTEGPFGVSTIWDTDTNSFNFSQLTVGDTLDLRIDLDVTTAGANETVKVYLKLGAGSASEYDLPIWDMTYKTADEHNVGKYFGFYIGSDDIRDYPAELYLVSEDGDGSVKVNGWYPRIIRKGVNVYTIAVSDNDYVKKQFAGSYSYDSAGDNAVLALRPEGYSSIALTNSSLNSVDGFNLSLITGVPGAYIPYTGKTIKIFNFTGSDVTLTHDGAADIPFLFRGAEDIVLPAGEVIFLDYNIGGCIDTLRSWDTSSGSANKQIFHWWGGNWTTTNLNQYYYIGYNGGAIIQQGTTGTAATTISAAMNGRNKGLFIAPFDCKIKRVMFKEGGSGSYTGAFVLASGLPNYGGSWNLEYTNVVTHLNQAISATGYIQRKNEFLVTDDIIIPKGYVVAPLMMFISQAQAGKTSIEISIEIEEVV